MPDASGSSLADSAVAFQVASIQGYSQVAMAWNDAYARSMLTFRDTGDSRFLRQALSVARSGLSQVRRDSQDWALLAANLSGALQEGLRLEPESGSLDEAVASAAQAVEASSDQHPDRAMFQDLFASALLRRFEWQRQLVDLDRATVAAEAATGEAWEGDPLRGLYFIRLSTCHRYRAERLSESAGVDASLSAALHGVQYTTGGSHAAEALSTLALALLARFRQLENSEDLDAAISASGRACRLVEAGLGPGPTILQNHSLLLAAQHAVTRDRQDVDEAIRLMKAAVATAPRGSPQWIEFQAGLSLQYHARFLRHSDITDLDHTVRIGRLLVEAVPDTYSSRADYLSNLGLALELRYRWRGELADLDSAIKYLQGAVDATGAEDPDRAKSLNNLALAYRNRHDICRAPEDLQQAVTAARDAVGATASTDPSRPGRLSTLGGTLQAVYIATGSVSALEEAVQAGEEAAFRTPEPHPDRPGHFSNLGELVRLLAERMDDLALLKRSIWANREAVEATPEGHTDRTGRLLNLANAQRSYFARTGERSSADRAVRHFAEAAGNRSGPTPIRVDAAWQWGDLSAAVGAWDAATAGYQRALSLLSELLAYGLHRYTREQHLARQASLGPDGAACALMSGHPEQAVQLLEQGRALLWSQMLELRPETAGLAQVAPELAARLEAVATGRRAYDQGPALGDQLVDQRMALAREWSEITAQVRELSGFEDFLEPPSLEKLLPAAVDGPIIIVNVSKWRCDALLVRAAGVEVTELPGLTLDIVTDKANQYLRALQRVDQAVRAHYVARQEALTRDRHPSISRYRETVQAVNAAVEALDNSLKVVLRWLWDEIADPVLTALGSLYAPDSTKRRPRLWWCPTGPLTLLPLHAAGCHANESPRGRTVLDRVVASYTPTLRALLEARRQPSIDRDARFLVVSLSESPGLVPLENALRDQQLLTSLFPNQHTLLDSRSATAAAVLEQLPRHRWAHFSCHGGQDLVDPSSGGLLLRDGTLTVGDIDVHWCHGEFVFLSACMTAVGGIRLPDEAISLAAALNYTGYRHVLGTMWSVYDVTAAQIAEAVYAELTSSGRFEPSQAAQALHRAILDLRDSEGLPARYWTPFVHIGL